MDFWRRRVIGLIALGVLAGTPLLGAVCAGLCAPGPEHHATAAAVHGTIAPCHETSSDGATLSAPARGECTGHDGASYDLATARATGRDNTWTWLDPHVPAVAVTPVARPPATRGAVARAHRAAPESPPRAPVVLRI